MAAAASLVKNGNNLSMAASATAAAMAAWRLAGIDGGVGGGKRASASAYHQHGAAWRGIIDKRKLASGGESNKRGMACGGGARGVSRHQRHQRRQRQQAAKRHAAYRHQAGESENISGVKAAASKRKAKRRWRRRNGVWHRQHQARRQRGGGRQNEWRNAKNKKKSGGVSMKIWRSGGIGGGGVK